MCPDESGSPRVGYVLKVFPRLSQTFVLQELLAHQRAGRPVEIFSLRYPKDRLSHRAVGELNYSVRYAASTDVQHQIAELVTWIREKQIRHLHAHFGNIAAATAAGAARECGITYSFTAHARDIFHEQVDIEALRHRIADAAFVATVSEFNAYFLRERYGSDAARVERIYNGLPLNRFQFESPVQRQPLLLAVGRWISKKGFEDLIEACARMERAGTTFRCEIVGSGELEAEYRRLIRNRKLNSRVTLIDSLPDNEVREKMHSAALLAAPCIVAPNGDRDGLPTVLLEAMALGTPCVSTPVTGIPEAIRDEETGLLVPPGDPAALAVACTRLLTDEPLCIDLARAARQHVEQEFDIDTNVRELAWHFSRAATVIAAP